MDADDFITKTALEELYTAAKNFNADVVYTGSRYRYTAKKGAILTHDRLGRELRSQGIEDKESLTIDNPHKNLQELLRTPALYGAPWTKFVQRNFLIENEITFFEILSGGDFIWTIELFACAKRLLRIPKAFYFWRDDSIESITRIKLPTDEQIKKWFKILSHISKALYALSNKNEVLKENPLHCFNALNCHFNFCFSHNLEARIKSSPEQIYNALRDEFKNNGEPDLMIPFLFSHIDTQWKNLLVNQHQFQEFAKKSQSRIVELEKVDRVNKAYISELENFIANSQKYIAELESELKRKEG